MITQILEENNKYFPCSLESHSFTIVADGVTGDFNETYLVGQYVNIHNSILNDGVYKITAVAANKITLDDTMLEETNEIDLFGLALPRGLLSVIAEILTYTASQTTGANISQESQGGQGGREVRYVGGSSWPIAFYDKLTPYRSLYDDRLSFCTVYNINTKRW